MSTFLEPQISNKRLLARRQIRENPSQHLALSIPPSLMNELNAACKQAGTNRSQFVRALLEYGLDCLQGSHD